MRLTTSLTVLCACLLSAPAFVSAQEAVRPAPDQAALLASPDPVLAANKRLVYDFWREVLEGGHMDLADKYLTEEYIQHNPTVPSGRAGFVTFFSQFSKARTIAPTIKSPLVSVVAEGDLVVLSFVREHADPAAPATTYTTTWFDMFRIKNGKIAEHWDPATKK